MALVSAGASDETRRGEPMRPPPDPAVNALSVFPERSEGDPADLQEVADLLSHELRTPLTTIYGGSKILSRPGLGLSPGTVREVSEAIGADAERLYRIIEDLVVAARPENREVGMEPVLLRHVLPAIVQHEQARWPETTFVLSLPDALSPVRGDDIYLSQLVRNLLANAARFGPAGGVVTISVAEADGHVSVRVGDQGPGIAPGEEQRVFELFYRAPETAGLAGLGLGLFVARRLTEAMGGTIWAANRPGGGAEFGFRLPVEPADER